MSLRVLFGASILLVAFLLFTPAFSFADALSEDERKEDTRLEKPVTLLKPGHLYLGELLEELSRQTGVALSAGDRDAAAGEKVIVRLQNVPLGDVMEALWSLFSYKHAYWDWEPVKTTGSETVEYRMLRPRAAQLFARSMREAIQKDFEGEAALLLAGLEMTPEQIRELETTNKAAANTLNDRVARAGLAAFLETLSAEGRQRVLSGQETAMIPADKLGEKGRAFVEAAVGLQRGGGNRSYPNPQRLKFEVRISESEVIPRLLIQFGNTERIGMSALQSGGGSVRTKDGGQLTVTINHSGGGHPPIFTGTTLESWSGSSYVGSNALEQTWQDRLTNLWIVKGDATTDPALESAVTPSPPGSRAPADTGADQHFPDSRLRQISRYAATPFSFMARVSLGKDMASSAVKEGTSVADALKQLRPVQTKWRRRILLACNHREVIRSDDENKAPYATVKQLRGLEETSKDNLLPLTTLASTARALNEGQLRGLASEFPVMDHVAKWRGLFARMDRHPALVERLQSPKGVGRTEAVPALQKATLPTGVTLDRIATLRMLVRNERPEGHLPSRSITFKITDRNGAVLAHSGFAYDARARDVRKAALEQYEKWEKEEDKRRDAGSGKAASSSSVPSD